MLFPPLFKLRQLWVPTFFGLIIMIVVVMAVSFLVLRNIATFLSVSKPVSGQYLVVEGWVDEPSLLEALHIYNTGNYQYLITTGGPDTRMVNPEYKSFAESAAAFIRKQGFDDSQLIVIPTPESAQERTYLSAVMVREWFIENKKKLISLDVFSSGVHARRSQILYQMAFAEQTQIGIIAASPRNYGLHDWWKTSAGAKSVLTEFISFVWTICCFYPGEYGSHQEKWGIY